MFLYNRYFKCGTVVLKKAFQSKKYIMNIQNRERNSFKKQKCQANDLKKAF